MSFKKKLQMNDKENNFLIPVHRKLDEKEISFLFAKFKINSSLKLPKIKIKDPGLNGLEAKEGDIIEIIRNSFSGETKYYRVVIK